jgi:hypothetical protein
MVSNLHYLEIVCNMYVNMYLLANLPLPSSLFYSLVWGDLPRPSVSFSLLLTSCGRSFFRNVGTYLRKDTWIQIPYDSNYHSFLIPIIVHGK